jgi:hypothetical protein
MAWVSPDCDNSYYCHEEGDGEKWFLESLNPVTREWEVRGMRADVSNVDDAGHSLGYSLGCPLGYQGSLAAVGTDKLVYSGGYQPTHMPPARWVHEFDVRKNEWRRLADMNVARQMHASVECGGSLYVSGGDPPVRSTERYDRATDKWVLCADMVRATDLTPLSPPAPNRPQAQPRPSSHARTCAYVRTCVRAHTHTRTHAHTRVILHTVQMRNLGRVEK